MGSPPLCAGSAVVVVVVVVVVWGNNGVEGNQLPASKHERASGDEGCRRVSVITYREPARKKEGMRGT